MEFKLVDFDPDNKPQKGNAEKVELKEGDRVRVSTKSGYADLVGKTGMVYAVDPKAGGDILVKLDGWNDGHYGGIYLKAMGRTVEEESNRDKWIFHEDDLYKIEGEVRDGKPQKGNEVRVEFKIGDRIRIKQNCMWTNVHGKTGTVYATNSPRFQGVLVKLDDFSDGHNGEIYLESLGRKPESEGDTSKWILSESDLYKIENDGQNENGKGRAEKVELKEGDRVRVSTKSGYADLVGKTGTVYATNSPRFRRVLVKVDDFSGGHNGELYLESLGRKPESKGDASKWILSESDLYKIENDGQNENGKGRAEEVQFKIGDRVKVTQNDENCGQKGTIVDVCKNLYLIRFDDQKRGHSGSFFYIVAGRADPRPEAETGYWILREYEMMPVCDGEDEKNGAKKPARRIVVIEINDDGAKARYFNGGKIPAKEAKVRRYYKDKPNDELAAIHAVSKLFGRIAGESKEDLETASKLKDALAEVEKFTVIARESVGEALYKLRQIIK